MTPPSSRQVLVGADASDRARRALAYALGLARRDGFRLVVAHVEEPPHPRLRTTGDVDRWNTDQRAVSDELQGLVEESCVDAVLDCDMIIAFGHPYPQLAALARARRVDAVIVGATGRPGHLLGGSVAGRLIRAGICPVTVVP